MPTDRYAVIGHPVDHSLSPTIHTAFAHATGENLSYDRIDAPRDGFADAAAAFFDAGGRGLNVTVPFKADAFAWCARSSERAARAEVVNTLSASDDGDVTGDNTDGVGLARDLQHNQGLVLAGCRILMIGAGGAARGVVGALLAAGPGELIVANRTEARAHELAERFAACGPLRGCSFEALADEPGVDLLVNASAASLGGALPAIPDRVLRSGGVAYDMMYGEKARPFLEWAHSAGASRALDGLGMLVEQAAESFFLWRGVRPPTADILARLRAGERD